MRLIDADVLWEHKFPLTLMQYHVGWNDAISAVIENAPTIDAVPVVRCKDCKHCSTVPHSRIMCCEIPMGCLGFVPTKADCFCSYGERRSNV